MHRQVRGTPDVAVGNKPDANLDIDHGLVRARPEVSVDVHCDRRGNLQRHLLPGDTVVEYTAGTTGISLAFVCAALGYPLHIVSDAFSVEKRRTMRAFGATVEVVPSDGGRINEKLIKSMIARAGEVAAEPGRWWCDQLNNHDAIDAPVLSRGGRGMDKTEMGHCCQGRLLLGHGPRGLVAGGGRHFVR